MGHEGTQTAVRIVEENVQFLRNHVPGDLTDWFEVNYPGSSAAGFHSNIIIVLFSMAVLLVLNK